MTKKRIFTWLAALVLFVSAMISFVALPKKNVASAAEAQVPKDLYYFRVIDHGDPQEEEDRIASLCQTFQKSKLINNYFVKVVYCDEVFQLIEGGTIFDKFIDFNTAYGDAFIYDTEGEELMGGHAEFLGYVFLPVKARKFRTMFISEVDEMFFYVKGGFLDNYVDIHINKDTYTQFLINVFAKIYDSFDMGFDWHNLTFILSWNLYQSGFIETRLFSLLETAFSSTLFERQLSVQDYCAENNIKILVYCADATFMDGFTLEYIHVEHIYDDKLSDYFEGQSLVAIGANWATCEYYNSANAFDDEWIDMANTIYDVFAIEDYHGNMNTIIFQYEHYPKEYYLPAYATYGPYDITYIIEDFVSCREPKQHLMQYDNWPGDCEITHKTLTFGSDGWMNVFDITGEYTENSFLGTIVAAWVEN